MTTAEQCVNYELNIQMCPCSNEDCDNYGICCECLQSHSSSGSTSACMGGTERDPETMGLAAQAADDCETNEDRNAEVCPCTYEPCDNKAVCCNCVRNHFEPAGTGAVACMR